MSVEQRVFPSISPPSEREERHWLDPCLLFPTLHDIYISAIYPPKDIPPVYVSREEQVAILNALLVWDAAYPEYGDADDGLVQGDVARVEMRRAIEGKSDFFEDWFEDGVRWACVVLGGVNTMLVHVATHGIDEQKIKSKAHLDYYVNNMPVIDVMNQYGPRLGYRGDF